MNLQKVDVYMDTDIYLDAATGYFSATPKGSRKQRSSRDLWGIKNRIKEFFERKKVVKRRAVKHRVRLYHKDKVVEADYIGTRLKSKNGTGHLFALTEPVDGHEYACFSGSWDSARIVPDNVSDHLIEEIRKAHEEVEFAKANLRVLIDGLVLKAELPSLGYQPRPADLDDVQDKTVEILKKTAATPVDLQ